MSERNPGDKSIKTEIVPVLSVRHGVEAVEFYQKAYGAVVLNQVKSPDGAIVAEMAIEGARFYVGDESPDNGHFSPQSLGGTTVRIGLMVADPDSVAKRAIECGAREIYPVADQHYGYRLGCVADPYGYYWDIGRPMEIRRTEETSS